MVYQTTSNQTAAQQMAGSLGELFLGNPERDAALQQRAIKNETEFARQKYLAEQTLSEATRRSQMQAAAAANQALADQRASEMQGRESLGKYFTQDMRDFSAPGGMSTPGDAPVGTPGAHVDFSNPSSVAEILAGKFQGNIPAEELSALALFPQATDDQIARIMVSSGNTLGKDEYVSLDDRNENRRYEVSGNERLADSIGNIFLGMDDSNVGANEALAAQRNAAATKSIADANAPGGSSGGKIPKLSQKELTHMIGTAIVNSGADLGDSSTEMFLSKYPDMYQNMAKIVDEAFMRSGGRSSAVQNALGQYLSKFNNNEGVDFSRVPRPKNWIDDEILPPTGPKVEDFIAEIFGNQNQQLPSRQDVGNVALPPGELPPGWSAREVVDPVRR